MNGMATEPNNGGRFCATIKASTDAAGMPRAARVVAVGAPHHITQRGNNRQGEAGDKRSRGQEK